MDIFQLPTGMNLHCNIADVFKLFFASFILSLLPRNYLWYQFLKSFQQPYSVALKST
jgi:hypothetical protein